MFLLTGDQMGKVDQSAISFYEIPGLILMENAALSVLEVLRNRYSRLFTLKIVVLAGKGNNGGDGFVIARHLLRCGAEVDIFTTADLEELRGDAAVNGNILHNTGARITKIREGNLDLLKESLISSHLIIDALLGTGFKGKPHSFLQEIIELVNKAPGEVVAVDIPSGVNAATGKVAGEAVRADITVTFACPKVGMLFYPGANFCGEIFIADIGIPAKVFEDLEPAGRVITPVEVKEKLPPRFADAHKGTYGRITFLAGSPGMTGAAVLAGRAALRGGAGLVYIAAPGKAAAVLESKTREEVVIPLAGDEYGNFAASDLKQLKPWLEKCSALAFGPGTSPTEENLLFLHELCRASPLPLVLDAGGLGALALSSEEMPIFPIGTIFTPHPGEMARLSHCSVQEVEAKRMEIARQKSGEWGVIVVLKGAPTVVAAPGGEVFVNSTGNTSLSTAGTGDILTGLIASLLAQGLEPLPSAYCGVFLHGLAADLWAARRKSLRGAVAGDFLEELPHVFSFLQKNLVKPGKFGPLNPCIQKDVFPNALYFYNR